MNTRTIASTGEIASSLRTGVSLHTAEDSGSGRSQCARAYRLAKARNDSDRYQGVLRVAAAVNESQTRLDMPWSSTAMLRTEFQGPALRAAARSRCASAFSGSFVNAVE